MFLLSLDDYPENKHNVLSKPCHKVLVFLYQVVRCSKSNIEKVGQINVAIAYFCLGILLVIEITCIRT